MTLDLTISILHYKQQWKRRVGEEIKLFHAEFWKAIHFESKFTFLLECKCYFKFGFYSLYWQQEIDSLKLGVINLELTFFFFCGEYAGKS